MYDKLYDAIFVLPPWATLALVTLSEDSMEELMWYMRVIHPHDVACPVKLGSEDHGLNAR